MKPYIYYLEVTDTGGFGRTELWASGYIDAHQRIFGSREPALAALDEHESFDYRATVPADDPREQPQFALQRLPTVEALYRAWCDDEADLFDAILRESGAPPVPGYTPGKDDLPAWDVLSAWIRGLPARVRRAAREADGLAATAEQTSKAAAATAGASSITHAYRLASGLAEERAARLRAVLG